VPDHSEPPEGERLQKILARAGLGSRRVAEDLIADGRVTVNGEVAVLGRRVDVEHDHIALDGVAVIARDDLVYYLLNKPAGHVSTAADPQGRPTVVELVPPSPRVYPVGRLDYETEGLLLLTNDGDLTQLLTHPSFGVVKTYLAEIDGDPAPLTVRRLREGVELDDGVTAPARAALVPPQTIKLSIHEGRNRQVRRMCAAVGHPVVRLVRTRVGPIAERRLKPGEWRPLTQAEVRALAQAAAAPGPPQ
jgi:23S rRNA pseudouridine2605 synthase